MNKRPSMHWLGPPGAGKGERAMDKFVELVQLLGLSLPSLAVAGIMLYIGKLVFNATAVRGLQDQLTEKDNPAAGVYYTGFILGLGVALAGALWGNSAWPGANFPETLRNVGIAAGSVAVDAVLVLVLMRLSILINDRLILYRFSIQKEMIQDRNLGTAFVVAGSCLATGLVLNGVFTGFSENWLMSLRDILVYWALGQVILVLGGLLFQRIAGYDVQGTIANDNNIPAGISFGGYLVALGLMDRAAIAGSGSDLWACIVRIVVVSVVGLIALAVVQAIVKLLFFRRSPLEKEIVQDRNAAAGAISAAGFVALAVLLAAVIQQIPTVR